jgi:CDP-diglyceride synthetase
MRHWLAEPYVTFMPALVAGVLNMVWVRLPVARRLKAPLDGGRVFKDGRYWLGPNKTYKGLVGMVALAALASSGWGWLCGAWPALGACHRVQQHLGSGLGVSLAYGIALGAAYALFELPNSFLKRRLGVVPGRSATGGAKPALIVLDQCDSVVGMVLVAWWPAQLTAAEAAWWLVLGGATHLALNGALYLAHLRGSPL